MPWKLRASCRSPPHAPPEGSLSLSRGGTAKAGPSKATEPGKSEATAGFGGQAVSLAAHADSIPTRHRHGSAMSEDRHWITHATLRDHQLAAREEARGAVAETFDPSVRQHVVYAGVIMCHEGGDAKFGRRWPERNVAARQHNERRRIRIRGSRNPSCALAGNPPPQRSLRRPPPPTPPPGPTPCTASCVIGPRARLPCVPLMPVW